ASPARVREEIGQAQRVLEELSGHAPRLFRAVVGMANVFVDPELRRHGLLRVAWSASGYDSISADPGVVWKRLRRNLRPGAIVLLHEGAGHGNSVATLRHVLQQLQQEGYRCVVPELPAAGRDATTSQLLNGVDPHSGVHLTDNPADSSSEASA